MANRIDSFRGTFLSNFWPARVFYAGAWYPSVENAYVAAKIGAVVPAEGAYTGTPLESAAVDLLTCKPGEAKRIGRRFPADPNWDPNKLGIMRAFLAQKFAPGPLRDLLLATGDAELVEGNTGGDVWWGVCRGKGENHLGRLLMAERAKVLAD